MADLSSNIGQPISGYPSSPNHDARVVSAHIHATFGELPAKIESSKGYTFRARMHDGRTILVGVKGTSATVLHAGEHSH